jgi:hypothetical protein
MIVDIESWIDDCQYSRREKIGHPICFGSGRFRLAVGGAASRLVGDAPTMRIVGRHHKTFEIIHVIVNILPGAAG